MKPHRTAIACFMCLSLLVVTSGCGMYDVASTWRDREVKIDGIESGDEWKDAKYFLEDRNITVGMMNDEDYLYIRVSSSDRAVHRQLLGQGLTIWLNDGNKNKTYGIKYPIGMMTGMPQEAMRQRQTDSPSAQQYDESIHKRLVESVKNLTIIGPAESSSIMVSCSDAESMGIVAQIGYNKGSMIYELRIPLHRDEHSPYGIYAAEIETVGVGFESEAAVRPQGGADRSRGGPKGDMNGMGGRRGGMSAGRRGGTGGSGGRGGDSGMQQPSMNEPLELWLKVRLAQR